MEKVFIEEQFPVSKISKESYKERKANLGQTLTGLGKWWGRKPLILIRASILGMLMPSSDDPVKDREIFLKILTLDDEGLWQRRIKPVPPSKVIECVGEEFVNYFDVDDKKVKWKKGVAESRKKELMKKGFSHLSYDEKIVLCSRPEEVEGPTEQSLKDINEYLGIQAKDLSDVFRELSIKRFGKVITVGDVFCGGGSIPFESSRVGLKSYGRDLSISAALLSWASLNVIGGSEDFLKECESTQKKVYSEFESVLTEWGIELNDNGDRISSLLYCTETKCPSCGYQIPLSPSWVVDLTTSVVVRLVPNHDEKNASFEVVENATKDQIKDAKSQGTIKSSRVHCFNCDGDFSISSIRGDRKTEEGSVNSLRIWGEDDFQPKEDDIFQERLYCIQWEDSKDNSKKYRALGQDDILREDKVVRLLKERWSEWKNKGFLPVDKIEKGSETTRLYRERGWSYWSHCFTARQLLLHGLLNSLIGEGKEFVPCVLGLGRIANWDSKLCSWMEHWGKTDQVFYNQAFNTVYNFSSRGSSKLARSFFINYDKSYHVNESKIEVGDSRENSEKCHIWLTDPPYADAVNYHELATFFEVWYKPHLKTMFPEWPNLATDFLAVQGSGADFKKSMVEIYTNLCTNMPDDGIQMVQFTHQDPSVWADLAMIMWAAGLRVTSAWTIGTETSTGLKKGNYVQGTVLLVLRKRLGSETAFLDELYPEIEDEVKVQLDNMLKIDDRDDPNFADTDYQLAAYAAALRVLTKYSDIDGQDIKHELFRVSDTKSEFEKVIDRAVEIACDHLVPEGFDKFTWKGLSSTERLYLKGLELEKHLEARSGAYQELAKGFGVKDYTFLYAKSGANAVRFKSATEFKRTSLGGSDFGESLVRNTLFALCEAVSNESVKHGLSWLRNETANYWNSRKTIIEILKFFSSLSYFEHMEAWKIDSEYAKTLEGAVANDHEGNRL